METAVIQAERLASRPAPSAIGQLDVERALFVPVVVARAPKIVGSVHIVTRSNLHSRASVP